MVQVIKIGNHENFMKKTINNTSVDLQRDIISSLTSSLLCVHVLHRFRLPHSRSNVKRFKNPSLWEVSLLYSDTDIEIKIKSIFYMAHYFGHYCTFYLFINFENGQKPPLFSSIWKRFQSLVF